MRPLSWVIVHIDHLRPYIVVSWTTLKQERHALLAASTCFESVGKRITAERELARPSLGKQQLFMQFIVMFILNFAVR